MRGDFDSRGSELIIPTLSSLSMRVWRADMSFGAAKRLPCEGGSRSIARKGSSSLAWLLENEGKLGEAGGAFCWWVGLGCTVGEGGRVRCVCLVDLGM